MAVERGREYVETLVIGGGQAGLSMGYQLSRRGLPYRIVDANPRIGDVWRNRWDSFRLFTPNRLNRLPGMRFPGYRWGFASKEEWADHLESYARKLDLQVETGVRVEKLTREGDRFVAISGDRRFEADNVVVAMSSWQRPRVPDLASELDRPIVQLHVAEYKNPRQLQEGDVLVVGSRQFWSRDRHRGGTDSQGDPVGSKHGRDPLPARKRCRPCPDADHRSDRLPPGANDQDPHREEGSPEDDLQRRASDSSQAQRPQGRGRRTCSSGHRRSRRIAATRGRPHRGGCQRRVVYGIPPRVLLDRPPRPRPPRALAQTRGRRIGARPLLHRSQVPLLRFLRTDPGSGPRRGLHRQEDRRRPYGTTGWSIGGRPIRGARRHGEFRRSLRREVQRLLRVDAISNAV